MSQNRYEQPTFAEAKGSEANQQAKKISQAKSRKARSASKEFYTMRGTKVLKIQVKAGGTYSEFVGNYKEKKHKALLDPLIMRWKKDLVWVPEHEVDAKVAEFQASFNK